MSPVHGRRRSRDSLHRVALSLLSPLEKGGASIFSKGERETEKAAAEQREGQPAGQGGGGGQ